MFSQAGRPKNIFGRPFPLIAKHVLQGGPGSVRLPFVHGTVPAVLVFGSDGSSLETLFQRKRTGPVPVSVPE